MRRFSFCFVVLLLAGFSMAAAQEAETQSKSVESVVIERRDFSTDEMRKGTFVPAVFDEVSLWFDEYKGELLMIEVVEHGTPVNDGDVIARIDVGGINKQIEQLERQVKSAALKLQNTAERNTLSEKSAALALDNARYSLEQARRDLEGWERYELDFSQRNAEMSELYTQHNIDDQKDELDQLEMMYRDDELTDATEEIVLKRSRRNLSRTMKSLKNLKDRRAYTVAFAEAAQSVRLRRAVTAKEAALDSLLKSQEIERRSREDGLLQVEMGLKDQKDKLARLKKDSALLSIRASRSGVLLHGSPDDYRPGRTAPRYKRGSRGSARTTLFTIADPDRSAVALDIPESKINSIRTGKAAKVSVAALPDIAVMGTMRVDRFPAPRSAGGSENSHDAEVVIESPVQGVVAGMRAEVKIVVEELKDVIVLPRAAVFGSGTDAHCWTTSDSGDEFQRIAVKLGPATDKEVVVYGVLSDGQKVLLCEPQQ